MFTEYLHGSLCNWSYDVHCLVADLGGEMERKTSVAIVATNETCFAHQYTILQELKANDRYLVTRRNKKDDRPTQKEFGFQVQENN